MASRLRRHALCAALVLALSGAGAAEAAPTPKPPTPAQIRAATARVKRSRALWATVNVCNTRRQPETIGVRAQMPALGFPTRMRMLIGVQYLDAAGRWQSVTGGDALYLARIGVVSAGLEQAGSGFTFRGYQGRLRGVVTFTWRRDGRVLLRVTRVTSARHPGAAGGDPAHYSAAVCVLP